MNLIDKLYEIAPNFIQNIAVTVYDILNYRKRYCGLYLEYKKFHKLMYEMPLNEVVKIQNERLISFLAFVSQNSPYFNHLWNEIDVSQIRCAADLHLLPVVSKEDVRQNIANILTINPRKGCVGNTGGTTGKSLTIYFTWENVWERHAILDFFRGRYGWHLGKKTAWFSGKKLLNRRDEEKKRFWKTDFLYNIRYYSTFNLLPQNIPHYLADLNRYRPEYISGFPSSIFEIANFAKLNNIAIEFNPKAIFTTAETLITEQVKVISEQFGTIVVDQYSSSEGAPFIVQCEFGKMHYLPATGIIEVVDENGNPAQEGEVLVTSFITQGTPLVRYRIGDRMRLSASDESPCACGCWSPVFERIEGRINDFIYSRQRGKINLGNVSNCIKYSNGIIKFQVIQDDLDEIEIRLVVDPSKYSSVDEAAVIKEFVNRLGTEINIVIKYVDEIENEVSGKYRLVKNSIYHLIQ